MGIRYDAETTPEGEDEVKKEDGDGDDMLFYVQSKPGCEDDKQEVFFRFDPGFLLW